MFTVALLFTTARTWKESMFYMTLDRRMDKEAVVHTHTHTQQNTTQSLKEMHLSQF